MISQIGSSPQVGLKIKIFELPPPRYSSYFPVGAKVQVFPEPPQVSSGSFTTRPQISWASLPCRHYWIDVDFLAPEKFPTFLNDSKRDPRWSNRFPIMFHTVFMVETRKITMLIGIVCHIVRVVYIYYSPLVISWISANHLIQNTSSIEAGCY